MQEVTQWIGKKNELSPRESVRLLQVHERCNGSAVKIQEAFQTCKLHVLQQPEQSSTLYPYQYHPKKILIQKRKNRIPGGNRPPRESILLNLCKKGASYPPQNNLVHHQMGSSQRRLFDGRGVRGFQFLTRALLCMVYGPMSKRAG